MHSTDSLHTFLACMAVVFAIAAVTAAMGFAAWAQVRADERADEQG